MNDALLSFLGLARRAGKLKIGFDTVCESIENKKTDLVLIASDAGKSTKEGIEKLTLKSSLSRIILPYTKDEMGAAIGKYAAVIAVTDEGFAKKIKLMCQTADV